MKIHNRKPITEYEGNWRKMESSRCLPSSPSSPSFTDCDELIYCRFSHSLWSNLSRQWRNICNRSKRGCKIPKDVPKGHMAVYVGQNLERYVIKISVLKHPLFRALLDQARDEFGFTTTSKLCLPCEESMFLDIIWSAKSSRDRRIWFLPLTG